MTMLCSTCPVESAGSVDDHAAKSRGVIPHRSLEIVNDFHSYHRACCCHSSLESENRVRFHPPT